jgi:hypothetical protein
VLTSERCLQAQGVIRRGAKLTPAQAEQERICVRFFGALVLTGAAACALRLLQLQLHACSMSRQALDLATVLCCAVCLLQT